MLDHTSLGFIRDRFSMLWFCLIIDLFASPQCVQNVLESVISLSASATMESPPPDFLFHLRKQLKRSAKVT